MKYYVIYEDYTSYNQFEGSWDILFKEFESFKDAEDWIKDSYEARDCRLYERKLIGPLKLC